MRSRSSFSITFALLCAALAASATARKSPRERAQLFVIGGANGGGVLKSVGAFWIETRDRVADLPAPTEYLGAAELDGRMYAVGGLVDGQRPSASALIYANSSWSAAPSMTTPRYAHGVQYAAGSIFAIGGNNGNAQLASVESFQTRIGKWVPEANMTIAREYPAVGAVFGLVYVAGGLYKSFYQSSVEVYNVVISQWSVVAPMSTARCAAAAVGVDTVGKLYVMGGFNAGSYLKSVEVFDVISSTWSVVAEMKTPRAWAGAVAFGEEGAEQIYVVGGRSSATTSLDTIEVYDVTKNAWSLLPARMLTPRFGHAVALLLPDEHVRHDVARG